MRIANRIGLVMVALVIVPLGCGSDDHTDQGNGGAGALVDAGATTTNATAAMDAAPEDTAGGPDGGGAIEDARSQDPETPLAIFDESRVHDVAITMSPDDWQSILNDSRGDEWRRATITYDGWTEHNVGVRPSGESSRIPGNPRMSVRLKFDAFTGKGKFGGLEELKLDGFWDDGSLIRERLSYFVLRTFMPAPREVHGRLVVNGELRGLYGVEEVWDDEALKTHFAQPVGPLYRLRGVMGMDPYEYRGPDPVSYVPLPWEPKGMRPMADHAVIGAFLRVLAEDPATIEQVLDMESVLTYFACNAIITNTDGFTGEFGADDHFQYFEPQSGKFHILPWDSDNTWGSINDPPDRPIYMRFSKSKLTVLIRDTFALRKRYKAKLTEVMTKLPIDALLAEADRIHQQVAMAAHEDPTKRYSSEHFEWSLSYIKDFATARYASVKDQVGGGP